MILDRASMAEWLEVIKANGQIGQEMLAHCERLCRLIDPSRENRIPLRHAAPASYPDASSSTAVEAFETWRDRFNEQITDAGGGFSLEVTPNEGIPFNQVLCWFEGERKPSPAAEVRVNGQELQSGFPSPAPIKRTTPPLAPSGGVEEHLAEWAADEGRSPVLLLLGEYGSGKSTECRRFAESLKQDKHGPDPVYLDLKKARQLFFSDTPNLRSRRFRSEDVRQLIDAAANSEEQSVEDIFGLIAAGHCVVICDGLDEIGSSLHPDEIQSFVQALLIRAA